MHIEKEEDFSKWLVRELTPICDADPVALAKYALALLKKDKSGNELKQLCLEQLDVFLGNHNLSFVENMFNIINTKGYYGATDAPKKVECDAKPSTSPKRDEDDLSENYEPSVSSKTELKNKSSRIESKGVSEKKAISINAKDEGKVSGEQNGSNRSLRKRISPPARDVAEKEREKDNKPIRENRDRRRSRSPRDRRNRPNPKTSRVSSGDRHRRKSRSRSGSRSPRRNERSRRTCDDFEKKGYCVRGEHCPYYHGLDPVVVDESALNNIVTLPAAATTNFSLPPPGYPLNPPPPGVPIITGEYNPETPALNVANYSVPPPPITTGAPWSASGIPTAPFPTGNFGITTLQQQGAVPSATTLPLIPGAPFRGSSTIRGRGRGGRGGGGFGRGGYHGVVNKEGSTIQVAKIPPEFNTIAKLNEHFASFGTIDNIQVRYNGEPDSALITFATKADAIRAHKSPTPVLNNRFIKVFWYKGNEGMVEDSNNGIGKQESEAKPPIEDSKSVEKPKITTGKEAKFVSAEIQNHRKALSEAKEAYELEKMQLGKLVEFQTKQNAMIEKWLSKQKEFLVKARTAENEADRKNATKFVKQLHNKIKLCKEEMNGIVLQISKKTVSVDKANALVESLKSGGKKSPSGGDESGRKRKIEDDGDESANVKISSVVVVRGVKESDVSDLMSHMEKFGETFDTSVKVDEGLAVAIFPYKRAEDASKALTNGKILNGIELNMELTTEKFEEIPSTDTNMSANELLASIPSGVESDEEDLINE